MLKLHQQLIHCPQHKEKIVSFNIEKHCPLNQRVLCKKCPTDGQKLDIEEVETLPQRHQLNEKHLQITSQFIQHINHQYNTLKQQIIEELDHFKKELDNFVHPIINQKEKFDYYLVPESTLTLKDFQELGQLLAENIVIEEDHFVLDFNKIVTQNHRQYIQSKFTDLELLLQFFRNINCNKQIEHQIQSRIQQQYEHNHQHTKLSKHSCQILQTNQNILSLGINYEESILILGLQDKAETIQDNLVVYSKNEQGNWELDQILQHHDSSVHHIYYSKKEDWFISVNMDSNIIFWRKQQNNWIQNKLKQEHLNFIWNVITSEAENIIVTCSEDSTVKIWFKHEDSIKCIQTLNRHIGPVYAIVLNNDNTVLCSGGEDKQLILWKFIEQQWEEFQVINVHSKKIMAIQFYGLKNIIVQFENYIQIIDRKSGQCIEQVNHNEYRISNLIYINDQLINYDFNGNLLIWMKKEDNRWYIVLKQIYAHKIKCVYGRGNELYIGEGSKVHRMQI
ncbi:unnamed protein product [Paramecium pentaurelia]|uniref:WD40-repeat-containing domain n=1 Tax=Paramecium pentaurelia TaxID=43138 RepID=A0A8S1UQ87_9CILI|nr:unnamed protein product [Paramecium pentaurelia]